MTREMVPPRGEACIKQCYVKVAKGQSRYLEVKRKRTDLSMGLNFEPHLNIFQILASINFGIKIIHPS